MVWLFVGLGNPGKQYEKTRHNLGFMALDRLSPVGGHWKQEFQALTQRIEIGGQPVVLAKPQTFMNLSGESVQPLLAWHKIPLERLVVFVDDIALDCGQIRVRTRGSHGGQNGLRSIIGRIGENFARVRIGAGRPPQHWDLADWVLSRFTQEEEEVIGRVLEQIPAVAECLVTRGFQATMERFNGSKNI